MPLQQQIGQLTFPKYNGHELSRTSTDLLFGSLHLIGWSELNAKWSRAPGSSYASRAKKQARTRGKLTITASMTVYETTWGIMYPYLTQLGAPQGLGPSEVAVPIVLTYFEPSLFVGSKAIELVGAQVIEAEEAIADADDQLTRKLTLDVMDMLEDGVSPVRERGLPGF